VIRIVTDLRPSPVLAHDFLLLRFILAGRGHDATEFQEAQAALGLSYSGHSLDWLFLGLFVLAAAFWLLRVRERITLRLLGRFLAGALIALMVVALLQTVNNAVFDRFFQSEQPQNHADWRESGPPQTSCTSRTAARLSSSGTTK
jgi:hypothetical protein